MITLGWAVTWIWLAAAFGTALGMFIGYEFWHADKQTGMSGGKKK